MGPEVPGIRKVLGVHGILRYWGPWVPGVTRVPEVPKSQDWVPLFYHALLKLDFCLNLVCCGIE